MKAHSGDNDALNQLFSATAPLRRWDQRAGRQDGPETKESLLAMRSKRDGLLELAAAIADGSAVDWDHVAGGASERELQALVDQLA
jgi:hypothetical protein